MKLSNYLLVAGAGLTTAHFGIEYPEWRASTLSGNENYSQWVYPCGGVEPNAGNRTDWPLDGGSLVLDLHHPWTYIFVNLGMGHNVTAFNVTLTSPFLNSTGNGTLCIPKLTLPADLGIKDGDEASLEVVTLGAAGQALYNCADIKFSAAAKVLEGDACKTVNVTYETVLTPETATSSNGSNSSGSGSGSVGTSAAGAVSVNLAGTSAFSALVMAAVYGFGL